MKAVHPSQPAVIAKGGVARFKPNKIVQFLLDNGPFDMNALARVKFSREDRIQFAQLIGYSVDGFAELSYVGLREAHYAECDANRARREKRRA